MMEERDRGHSVEAAVEIAAGTSGRAVLISGVTVMTAMAGLLFAGNPIFVGFGSAPRSSSPSRCWGR